MSRRNSARSNASKRSTTADTRPGTSGAIKKKEKKDDDIVLPAFSILPKSNKTVTELEKLKRKTIRRNAPPGEDLKEIKKILRKCKETRVTVQEFVGLVSPFTGDNGEALRAVMNDDLNTFRKLARRVYETITQDNSDVLINQQMQLADYYRETQEIFRFKTMRAFNEIYEMVPNFEIERYMRDGEDYLKDILPVPDELQIDPDELEMLKRQEAYHRLQWLRSEGERLKEENSKLQSKLSQLKKQYKNEQSEMHQMEHMAEKQHEILEAHEAEKEDMLEKLNESLERSIIDREIDIRKAADENILADAQKLEEKGVVRRFSSKRVVKPKVRRSNWREVAAAEVDKKGISEKVEADIKKMKAKAKRRNDEEAFHYSPIKTPPQAGPSNYQAFMQNPEETISQQPQSTRTEATKSVVLDRAKTAPSSRRGQAPRDTWGGFY